MKILLTVICSLTLLNVFAQQYDALKITTHPIAGKKLMMNYIADATTLSSADQVSGTAYFYSKYKQTGEEEFRLEKIKGAWNGSLKIPDSTIFLSLVFSTPDGKSIDNNHNKGYLIPFYEKGKPVQFAYAGMAGIFGDGLPDAAGLKKSQKQALIFMKEEIRVHPESEAKFMSSFYNMLANSPEREDKVELLKRLHELKSDKEDDLMMAQLYLSYFGGKRQADSLDKLLIAKYPNGNYVKSKALQARREANKKAFETYGGTSQRNSLNKADILRNVKDNLVDEPVSPLTLKDMDGKEVTLGGAAMKGKVMVIDFWATWCKPCVKSFPSMQQVMDKYKSNTDVLFFYICTMEHGDAISNVKEFLSKNPLPFKILMDEKTTDMNMYKAYTHYKVNGGIPYKLVIDGNSHIRTRSTGYSGNEYELITELSAMIDIALQSKK